METEAERRRREQYLEEVDNFRANAFKIIEQMVDWANQKQGSRYLVDEILHSIFFLGRINDPQFSPELILTDPEIYSAVSESYPQPFRCFSSELPRRSPFSCVLDMVVMLNGEENENAIRGCLQDFVSGLAPGYLVSSTICISQNCNTAAAKQYVVSYYSKLEKCVAMLKGERNENVIKHCLQDFVSDLNPENLLSFIICICPSTNPYAAKQCGASSVLEKFVSMLIGEENENAIRGFLQDFVSALVPEYLLSSTTCICQKHNTNAARRYGVSMSSTGSVQREIMIAASCCSTWEEYVAGAVMTYYPHKQKKPYFDGTFKIPDYVRCQTFNIRRRGEIPPCKSCSNMFGLPTTNEKEWAYGNCAENESLSNLLKNDPEVKRQSQPTSSTYTPVNKAKAKQSLLNRLTSQLEQKSFEWNGCNYRPQMDCTLQ